MDTHKGDWIHSNMVLAGTNSDTSVIRSITRSKEIKNSHDSSTLPQILSLSVSAQHSNYLYLGEKNINIIGRWILHQ